MQKTENAGVREGERTAQGHSVRSQGWPNIYECGKGVLTQGPGVGNSESRGQSVASENEVRLFGICRGGERKRCRGVVDGTMVLGRQ